MASQILGAVAWFRMESSNFYLHIERVVQPRLKVTFLVHYGGTLPSMN